MRGTVTSDKPGVTSGEQGSMFGGSIQRRPVSHEDLAEKGWEVELVEDGWIAFNTEMNQQTLPMESESMATEGAANLQYALDNHVITSASGQGLAAKSATVLSEHDQAFRRALHSTQGSAIRWEAIRKRGATDAELYKAISSEMGDYSVSGPNRFVTKSGSSPKFYYGVDSIKGATPTLQGKKMIEKTRELLKIGEPEFAALMDETGLAGQERVIDLASALNIALRHALTRKPGAWQLWLTWKAAGLTDKQIHACIQNHAVFTPEIGEDGKYADEHLSYTVAGAPIPRFWLGNDIDMGNPTLQGKALIDAVRNVLELPYPEEQNPSATADSTDTGSAIVVAPMPAGIVTALDAAQNEKISTVQTPAPTDAKQLDEIFIVNIDFSKTNPRKNFDQKGMEELAASIKAQGVIEPVIVRRNPAGAAKPFELIAGERRARAALMAGLTKIPAVIREVDDKTALDIQRIENLQRQDITAIEEAEDYQYLISEHRYEVKDIAARIGKSAAYIYGSLKLVKIPKAIRDALLSGEISTSVAIRIGRIPNQKMRETEGAKILSFPHMRTDKAVAEYIARNCMMELKGCTFNPKDATLVPEAGSCKECPKLTGNNRTDFPAEESRADICTDPACFKQKTEALIEKQLNNARQKGLQVLTKQESQKLFPYGSSLSNSSYVDMEDRCYAVDGNPRYKELLGDKATKIVALDLKGNLHYVVKKSEAERILIADKKIKKPKDSPASRPDNQTNPEEARRQRRIEDRIWELEGALISAAASKVALTADHLLMPLTFIVNDLLDMDDDSIGIAAARRLWVERDQDGDVDLGKVEKLFAEELKRLDAKGMFGLMFELTFLAAAVSWNDKRKAQSLQFRKLFGIDSKAVAKEAKQQIATEDKAIAAEAKQAAKTETKAKKKK